MQSKYRKQPLPKDTADLILIIDDNEIKRYTARRTLERAGFQVEETTSAAEALARLHRMDLPRPQLLVMDVKMPDVDGFELCRRIRADAEISSILICHLSAHLTSYHDQAIGLEAGADAYLTIPVESEVLIATVRSLMRLAHAEEERQVAVRHWSATFDAITDAICLIDREGRIVRCNQATIDLFGTPPEALIGALLNEIASNTIGLSLGNWLRQVDTAADAEPAPTLEVSLPGRGRWLRVSADPVRDADGGIGNIVCILSDITPRKRLEEQLQAGYERERRISDTFQNALLTPPSENAFHGYDIATFYESAWNEAQVGGDFFDAFMVGDASQRRLALAVGDASGKGLDAAMRAAEVKHILRAIVWETPEPAEALRRLNKYVCSIEEQKEAGEMRGFIAVALALIDCESGATIIGSAGSETPLIATGDGQIVEISAVGMPLGVYGEAEFETVHLTMEPGDFLLLPTDGITEARQKRSAATECFGIERMIETVQAASTAAKGSEIPPLRRIGDTVLDQARSFAGGTFQDDVCLLMIRRQPLI